MPHGSSGVSSICTALYLEGDGRAAQGRRAGWGAFVERLARALRFAAGKQAGPGTDRRAGGFTARGARRNFERRIVSDAL